MTRRWGAAVGLFGLLVGCQAAVTPEVQRSVRLSPASLPPASALEPEPAQRVPPHQDALGGDTSPIVPLSTPSPRPSALPTTARWTVTPQPVVVVADSGQPVQFSPPLSQLTCQVAALPQRWRVDATTVAMREKLNGVWGEAFLAPSQDRVVIGPTTVEANRPATFVLDALDPVVRPAFSEDLRAVLPTDVTVTLSVFTTPPLTPNGGPMDVVVRFKRDVPDAP